MENVFVNSMYPKKSKYDFIVTSIGIKVEDFEAFLKEHKEWALNENKGFLSIDVMKTKSDADKFYCKMTKYSNNTELTSKEFMNDRNLNHNGKLNGDNEAEDDLPF
jgi:hypothetical protein